MTAVGEDTTAPERLAALEQLSRSFKATFAAVRRLRGRETHHPGELSHAQYGLLFGLAAASQMSTGELAIAADLSPATVTQMLESLAAAGLVERTRSDRDKRVVLTSLTRRGADLVAARRTEHDQRWRRALDGFDDAQLLTAAAVLGQLRVLFDEYAGDGDQSGN
jgi:DNA-binding MarR family transcriptional regulator